MRAASLDDAACASAAGDGEVPTVTIKAQILCAEIRHFFAPQAPGALVPVCRCGETADHPIHLIPGDREALVEACDATAERGRRLKNAAA